MAKNHQGKGSTLLPPAVCGVLGLMGGSGWLAQHAWLSTPRVPQEGLVWPCALDHPEE